MSSQRACPRAVRAQRRALPSAHSRQHETWARARSRALVSGRGAPAASWRVMGTLRRQIARARLCEDASDATDPPGSMHMSKKHLRHLRRAAVASARALAAPARAPPQARPPVVLPPTPQRCPSTPPPQTESAAHACRTLRIHIAPRPHREIRCARTQASQRKHISPEAERCAARTRSPRSRHQRRFSPTPQASSSALRYLIFYKGPCPIARAPSPARLSSSSTRRFSPRSSSGRARARVHGRCSPQQCAPRPPQPPWRCPGVL